MTTYIIISFFLIIIYLMNLKIKEYRKLNKSSTNNLEISNLKYKQLEDDYINLKQDFENRPILPSLNKSFLREPILNTSAYADKIIEYINNKDTLHLTFFSANKVAVLIEQKRKYIIFDGTVINNNHSTRTKELDKVLSKAIQSNISYYCSKEAKYTAGMIPSLAIEYLLNHICNNANSIFLLDKNNSEIYKKLV